MSYVTMMKVEEKKVPVWDAHAGQGMLTLFEWKVKASSMLTLSKRKVEGSSRQDQMMPLVRWEGTISTVSVMKRISDDD